MITIEQIIQELALRHRYLGYGEENNHSCRLGDESQVSSDTLLAYPCVLFSTEIDGYSKVGETLQRKGVITMLFLNHVVDTANFSVLEEVKRDMGNIAEHFIKAMWNDYRCLGIQLFLENVEVQTVENIDACLYGRAVMFRYAEPICMYFGDDSPFLPIADMSQEP